jgi:hypothetical protein
VERLLERDRLDAQEELNAIASAEVPPDPQQLARAQRGVEVMEAALDRFRDRWLGAEWDQIPL